MKCDRCGNESKYLVRVLSEQDVTDSGMSSRGTEPRTEPLPIDQQWCLNCINQQNNNNRMAGKKFLLILPRHSHVLWYMVLSFYYLI